MLQEIYTLPIITKKPMSFIWSFAKKNLVILFFSLFCSLAWATNQSLFPYFIKIIINNLQETRGLETSTFASLVWPVSGMLLTWGLMEISLRIQGYVIILKMPKLKGSIREYVYSYVNKHSYEYFTNHLIGNISHKISDLPRSCESVIQIITSTLVPVILTISYTLVLMWSIGYIFFEIMFFWVVCQIYISLYFYKKCDDASRMHSEALSELNGRITDSISNMYVVRLFFREKHENSVMKEYQTREIVQAKNSLKKIELMKATQGVMNFILIISMMASLIYGFEKETVSLGDFSLVSMLSFSMIGIMWGMGFQVSVLFRELGFIKSALDLLGAKHETADIDETKHLNIYEAEIKFKNVSFRYKNTKKLFDKINVCIEGGQKVGLVGFTGSGKTTFVNLILRSYELESGKILIDNQDITSVSQQSLREQIAVIPQEPWLFHRSIKENIKYGNLGANDEEIVRAAKLAECHEFIEQLENGYDTIIGDKGVKLSSGQRQRISIARAVIKNAKIIILDEATSSLDSVTEKNIQKNLSLLMANKTTIVIAHRLTTLLEMDRILVFNNGKIIEDGTLKDLLNSKGHFSNLWNNQIDGFISDKTEINAGI